MSAIHFVGGEKGGVGKSVVSRLLSQFFLDRGMRYAGLDADQSHATLTRYYDEFTRGINLDEFESTDQIMELAMEADQHVLIDLPAQSQRFLDRWIEENAVLDLCEEMNIPVYFWYVVDDGRDSVQLLARFIDQYQDLLSCIVVKNQGCGKDFSEIEALPALNLETDMLKVITVPALHSATLHRVDKLNFSFWAAANVKSAGAEHLSLMERQRTKVWLKKAYEGFDSVLEPAPVAVLR